MTSSVDDQQASLLDLATKALGAATALDRAGALQALLAVATALKAEAEHEAIAGGCTAAALGRATGTSRQAAQQRIDRARRALETGADPGTDKRAGTDRGAPRPHPRYRVKVAGIPVAMVERVPMTRKDR